MSRARADSDDLPGELEDILEGDDEPQRPNFDDSDEFDPTALLSQPLFDDSNGDLDVNEAELADIQSSRAAHGDHMGRMTNVGISQQANFQQQSNNFSPYDMNSSNHNQQQQMPNMMTFYPSNGSPDLQNRALSPGQQDVNLKVREVQRKIQQVQEQIQRVQLESTSGMVSPAPQSSMPQQPQEPLGVSGNYDLQAMMNNQVGMTMSRHPPGRSVSMPTRRSTMAGNPMNNNQPSFMMQQPMHLLQQQQAMMGNSNGSSVQSSNMNSSMQNFNQGMDQQQLIMGNNLDGSSMHGSMNNMQGFNNQGMSVDQLQQGMMGATLDGSLHSHMPNILQGFNQGMDGSMNSPLVNMQQQHGFKGMDNSVQSMPANMGMGISMLQQQMGNMSNMPFGDSGPIRQNSLPHANSSNIGMLPNQTGLDSMIGPQNFDLSQMQRAFQAQGLIPGPAGAMQQAQMNQVGQPGVNGAMEKLCESMRRSAMSRSLVKQLSGHSIARTNSGRVLTTQHSARSLSRQNSGRLTKQSSGRSISRANSGRSIQRSASGRAVEGELPVRRLAQDAKHRIQRDALSNSSHTPGRGVLRHKSQSAILGANNQKTVLNIDGNSVGMF